MSRWTFILQFARPKRKNWIGANRAGAQMASNLLCSNFAGNNKNKFKAVIFDMGGVFISAPLDVWTELEVEKGLEQGSLIAALLHPDMRSTFEALECGQLSIEEFEEPFTTFYAKQYKQTGLEPIRLLTAYKERMVRHENMVHAARAVRALGLKTSLLTNNFWFDKNRSLSLLGIEKDLFDVVIESCRVGIRKPDEKIYHLVLEKLNCKPEEAIFLDDIGINLKAARALGITTIQVKQPHQAISELENVLQFSLSDKSSFENFPAGTTEVRKGMEIPKDSVSRYLKSILDFEVPESEILLRQYKHGQSNPTYFVGYGARKLVLRKKPVRMCYPAVSDLCVLRMVKFGKLLESAHMVEREYRVMKAVADFDVPVPKVLSLCENNQIIGTPFYIMDYVPGRIFIDPNLAQLAPRQRREIYTNMNDVLCRIHSVEIKAAGLEDFGKRENYLQRQIHRWTKQYEASKTDDIPSMSNLVDWLKSNVPANQRSTLVHGDFRLDNLIYSEHGGQVLAVLDWELSTLGDPLTDLATCCLAYYLPSTFPLLKGLSDRLNELPSLGIPSVREFVGMYCRRMGVELTEKAWNFYIAFICFRFAAILQGVYKRALQGQASAPNAIAAGQLAKVFADIAWQQAKISDNKKESIVFGGNSGDGRGRGDDEHHSKGSKLGLFPVVPQDMQPRALAMYNEVKKFIANEILPLEKELVAYAEGESRWTPNPLLETIKEKAKSSGVWNLFIPLHLDPQAKFGRGLTNVEYAFMCELMGRCVFAPEMFNCSAPDTGNMEVLIKYANEEQKKVWLTPLLNGEIRSCFAMTEPAVASSDATNIQSEIKKVGDSYVINGHKWYISGANDPRCKICIFMGKTDSQAARHKQQSMILVPMDTPGIHIKRPLQVFGFTDPPSGHAEIVFENVTVPAKNLIYGEGRGFEIAQGRLGPGRIHHCMRLIGSAERALDLMTTRTLQRTAFGKRLAEQGVVQEAIAKSRIEIEQCRLLVLKAAHMMDTVGNKVAAPEIAMIKVAVPNMALRVIDRAIQVHGALGVSGDSPLAMMYGWARALRLADGPDEVHLSALAKHEIKSKL